MTISNTIRSIGVSTIFLVVIYEMLYLMITNLQGVFLGTALIASCFIGLFVILPMYAIAMSGKV